MRGREEERRRRGGGGGGRGGERERSLAKLMFPSVLQICGSCGREVHSKT